MQRQWGFYTQELNQSDCSMDYRRGGVEAGSQEKATRIQRLDEIDYSGAYEKWINSRYIPEVKFDKIC